jgi:hypothetical protein
MSKSPEPATKVGQLASRPQGWPAVQSLLEAQFKKPTILPEVQEFIWSCFLQEKSVRERETWEEQ